ncbi:MAG TPA: MBL fold metallo-hydrolase [Ignavibacteriaceae bacterium]|nr:MBL fold metallo-hydrolase [Ignavibacteriaceae bacterium]
MKITFTGTGSAMANPSRYHSSLLLSDRDENVLIDCGDGIARQLMQSGIPMRAITCVVITHLHPDHFAGLPGLILNMKLAGKFSSLRIVIDSAHISFVKNLLNQLYVYTDRLGFELLFTPIPVSGKVEFDTFSIIMRANSHLQKYLPGYKAFSDGFVSYSVEIIQKSERLLYSSDIGSITDVREWFNNSYKYLIFEVTHISLFDIKKIMDNTAPSKVLLTHIPRDKEEEFKAWHVSLKEDEKARVVIAYDNLAFTL